MKEVIKDWLEEAFSIFDDSLTAKKTENSLISSIVNEAGQCTTPKPLFPVFLNNVELDSEFLIDYFDVITKSLKTGLFETTASSSLVEDSSGTGFYQKPLKQKRHIEIEYERKNIYLSKTVFPVFELFDTYVSNWSSHYSEVLSKNSNYEKYLLFRNSFSDNFCDKSSSVGYSEQSGKQIETIPIVLESKYSLVTSYLLKKYYFRSEFFVKSSPKTFNQYIQSRTKFRKYDEFLSKISEYPSIMKKIKKDLYILEKCLDYNTFENTINSYNNSYKNEETVSFEEFKNNNEKNKTFHIDKISTNLHLQFHLNLLISNYHVNCLKFSSSNASLFVAGYGVLPSEEMNYEPKGFVICWNIHKCNFPEKIYCMPEIVNYIDISESKPYLIAVGMRYGLIAVIDLRKAENTPSLINTASNMRSTNSIQSVQWIEKKYSLEKINNIEMLLSLSMDGSIMAWNVAKFLEGYELKTIKHKSTKRSKHSFLSNALAGICMQVQPNEKNILAVGTMEGEVHITNTGNPDDDIEVKTCNFGAINDLKWSSLVNNVYLTCGTDRCVHLWELHGSNPLKTLIFQDNVLKLSFSSVRSTMFAVMTKNSIFIFDLSIHLHNPISEVKAPENNFFTFITFCPKNNWILTGYSNGIISLYEITGLSVTIESKSDLLRHMFLPEQ